jgi:WD40 repeat protein
MGAATFSADGANVAVAIGDGSVKIVDTATGKLVQEVKGLEANVQQNVVNQFNMGGPNWGPLSFSRDGKRLAGAGHHGMVRIWDVATGKEVKQPEVGHDGTVTSVAFSADGQWLLTVGDDHVVLLWDRAKNTVKQRFTNPAAAAAPAPQPGVIPPSLAPALALSSDGKRLAIGWPDGNVQVLETETAKEVRKFKAHENPILAMLLTTDGRSVITSSSDGKVIGWSIATGKQFHHFAGPVGEAPANPEEVFGPTQAIARSADGRLFATVGMTPDGTHSLLRIWELATGKVRREIKVKRANNEAIWGAQGGLGGFGFGGVARLAVAADIEGPGQGGGSLVRFAPDGRTIAWATGNNIELWNIDRGREIRRFGLAEGAVAELDFAPDGKMVAAAGTDGTVRLWEVATGTMVARLEGHRGPVAAIAFATDGKTLATGGADTTVNVWDVPGAVTAAQMSPAALADKELETTWKQFVGEDSDKVSAALDRLAGSPAAAVALAKQHAKPVAAPEPARLAKLVAELEDARFETRQQAAEALEKLGELADKALRKRLDDNPSLDVRQRIEELLDKSAGLVSLPEHIRALRVVELLERIGTPEAKTALQDIAKGAPDARLTRDAVEALDRLNGKK